MSDYDVFVISSNGIFYHDKNCNNSYIAIKKFQNNPKCVNTA